MLVNTRHTISYEDICKFTRTGLSCLVDDSLYVIHDDNLVEIDWNTKKQRTLDLDCILDWRITKIFGDQSDVYIVSSGTIKVIERLTMTCYRIYIGKYQLTGFDMSGKRIICRLSGRLDYYWTDIDGNIIHNINTDGGCRLINNTLVYAKPDVEGYRVENNILEVSYRFIDNIYVENGKIYEKNI